tara:strand:- start:57 stop:344 length:288 start_codon:yes stop_codon:yes gene_type:complete
MAGAAIGRVLAKGLSNGLAKNVGKQAVKAKGRGTVAKVAKAKSVENLRQGGIIEANEKRDKIVKTKAFKEKAKQAKAKKQKSFTVDGQRFMTDNF